MLPTFHKKLYAIDKEQLLWVLF